MPSSYDEKKDVERESADIKKEPAHHITVAAVGVDDAVRLTLGKGTGQPLDPEAALKLRKKIDRHLLPLMMICTSTLGLLEPISDSLNSVLGTVHGQDYIGEQCYPGYSNRYPSGRQPVSLDLICDDMLLTLSLDSKTQSVVLFLAPTDKTIATG
jgi:hypothetical protein